MDPGTLFQNFELQLNNSGSYRVCHFFPLDGDEVGDHVVLVRLQLVPGAFILLHPGQVARLVEFDPERVDWFVFEVPLPLCDEVGLHGVQGEHQPAVIVHSSGPRGRLHLIPLRNLMNFPFSGWRSLESIEGTTRMVHNIIEKN